MNISKKKEENLYNHHYHYHQTFFASFFPHHHHHHLYQHFRNLNQTNLLIITNGQQQLQLQQNTF